MLRPATVAFVAMLAFAPAALRAQIYYTINGQPASPGLSYMLAARGLPFGNYWLRQNGDWGVIGSFYPIGNIHANAGNAGNARPGYYDVPRTRCRTWGTGQMRCD